MAEEVGSWRKHRAASCRSEKVEAEAKMHPDLAATMHLVLDLKRVQEFRGPVTEAHGCGTVKDCEDVEERVSSSDLQDGLLGAENVQKKTTQATEQGEEREGQNDPQHKHRLSTHTEIVSSTTL